MNIILLIILSTCSGSGGGGGLGGLLGGLLGGGKKGDADANTSATASGGAGLDDLLGSILSGPQGKAILGGIAAFAADAMGFISGEEQVSVSRSGRWTRLAFRRGHVLSRGPVASGLTSVRPTGSAPAE